MEIFKKIEAAGLKVNPQKCSTLTVWVHGKTKQWAIDPQPHLTLDSGLVPACALQPQRKKAVKNSLDKIIQKARKQHDTRKMSMKNMDVQNLYTSLLKRGLILVKPIINSTFYNYISQIEDI